MFSFLGDVQQHPEQVPCHITYTTEKTHDIIRANLSESPMYSGVIDSNGPRYCPSIEDKVVRFADKNAHQIFIEPEGLTTHEIYPNGISTSLSFETQVAFVRAIKGFENAHITRPGYAIEYDFFDPRELLPSLETKHMPGLFFAGQINGTTGYEEAAAQGLIAGMNAVHHVREQDPWTPRRDEAYMGVLIDDLTTLGTLEPYRMFTSRAEYRLLLREDNADLRLTEQGHKLGLVDEQRWQHFNKKREAIETETQRLHSIIIRPDTEQAASATTVLGKALTKEARLTDLIKRPEVNYTDLMSIEGVGPGVDDAQVAEQIDIQAKYAGYIDRQQVEIERLRRYENTSLSQEFNYDNVVGLSAEVKEKLQLIKPTTVGKAARIPGVTPAAISLLLVHLKKRAG